MSLSTATSVISIACTMLQRIPAPHCFMSWSVVRVLLIHLNRAHHHGFKSCMEYAGITRDLCACHQPPTHYHDIGHSYENPPIGHTLFEFTVHEAPAIPQSTQALRGRTNPSVNPDFECQTSCHPRRAAAACEAHHQIPHGNGLLHALHPYTIRSQHP